MNHYSDIFFDLDRTLWDFDKNSSETLEELFDIHGLKEKLSVDKDAFLETFRSVNAEAWREFRMGSQTKEEMRNNRFVKTFYNHGSNDWQLAGRISEEYLAISPYKTHLVEGAKEVLENIKSNYKIHLITNGFSDTQRIKIKHSGLEEYFKQIIISEETSYRKPEKGIFKLAVHKARTKMKQSIMVGDDWQKDILGAKNAGMDQIYFNPKTPEKTGSGATFEIKNLKELLDII